MVALGRSPVGWRPARAQVVHNAEPGSILVGRQREFCRTWPNQTEVPSGLHFIQEDSADEIATPAAGCRTV